MGVRRMYAEKLEREGVLQAGEADQMADDYISSLEDNQVVSRELTENPETLHLVNLPRMAKVVTGGQN